MSKTDPAAPRCAGHKSYEVTLAREIAGAWRALGETLTLCPAQARYYLPPLGRGLKALEPKEGPRRERSGGS